jgi:hypothetical protein
MQGNVVSYRQGASGAHPVFARQVYRRQLSIMGPLHRGFGFNPDGILLESKDVARKRADEAESRRRAAQSVSLQVGDGAGSMPQAAGGFGFASPADSSDGSAQPGLAAGQSVSPQTRLDWQDAPRTPTLGQLSRARPVIDFGTVADTGAQRPTPDGISAISSLMSASEQAMAAPIEEQPFVRDQGLGSAAALTGRQPGAFAVTMGVFVDSSVCFALLTLANLGVHLGNWAGRSRFLARELSVAAGVRSIPDEVWHWVIVLTVWSLSVYVVQWVFAHLVRSTVGRFLAGICVDPVASRSRGGWSLPTAEVLTFGGLFVVPLLWLKTDRHPLLRSLRFHVPPG